MKRETLAHCESLSESELLQKHDRLIRGLATRFASCDADDLCQVGRIALLQAFRTWSQRSQFWTYARRRVFGAMMDHATREAEYARDNAEGVEQCASTSVSADEHLFANELFESLSSIELEIVQLSIRDGFGFYDIAEKLGRSYADVYRIYQGAMATLRERAS